MRFVAASVAAAVLLVAAAAGDATPPCCASVPAGLVSWWPAGGTAADVIGGHDGTLLGDATFAAGRVGQGFSFDGDDDYVSVPDSPALYSTGSFSVDAWVKTNGDGAVITHYECGGFCVGGGSNSDWEVSIFGGHLAAYIRDADAGGPDAGGQTLLGTVTVTDGAFHHLAVVRDIAADKLLLYVDGALDTSAALNAGSNGPLGSDASNDSEADPVTIGIVISSAPALVEDFTGVIDEADYFDAGLTPQQIAAIAAAGANGKCTDEVAPTSAATAPSTSAAGAAISVSYTAADTGGAGLARVILLVRTPGATGFTEAATDTSSSGTGTFTYTPTAGPGDYGFVTAGEDANCGREAVPADPDAITTVAAATTSPPPATKPPATTPTAPKTVPITQIATLPSAHVCVSRRHFPIHLKGIKGIVKAVIKLTGVPARTIKGKALGLPVDLRGLPKGKVVVRITITTKSGKRLVGKRTYHTCANKRIVKKKKH
jgi:hypothetical protein